MIKPSYITIFVFLFIINTACQKDKSLSGTIDYIGDSQLILNSKPIHYKYAPLVEDTLKITENGEFSHYLSTSRSGLQFLHLDDNSYPIINQGQQDLKITISRADFPQNVQVQGYPENWNTRYQNYLEAIDGLDSEIEKEEDKFKKAETNQVLELSQQKYELAQEYLNDTPLRDYYLKAIGEYLVFRIREVEYNGRFLENYNADSARTAVIRDAKNFNFFSLESLLAQRAGIRDFAHYYSRTFGIYDRLKAEYEKDLAEYDLKRLGYEELNEKRLQVIDQIEDRDAEAYARMYLVAERIGEQPLEVATPSYLSYLKEFSDYSVYTSFLTYFYEEIKSVSPGQPAIPFELPDPTGDLHTMDDYKGKFVLLDFWAGWCQPCLDEFSYMRDIYSSYSRKELEIIGISNEVDSLVWVQDLQRFDLPWVQLYSGDGFDEKTFKAYKGGGIPFYILIDPDGNIARYNDLRPSFNFTEVLDSLISHHDYGVNQ